MGPAANETGVADGQLHDPRIHAALKNPRRRRLLTHLFRAGGTLALRELADAIADEEADELRASDNLRQSVYVSLHQTHLPTLDDQGLVDYDRSTNTVTLKESARDLAVYFEVVPKYELAWSEFFLALGVLATLVQVGVAVGTPVLRVVAAEVWAASFLVLIGSAALYQLVTDRRAIVHRW